MTSCHGSFHSQRSGLAAQPPAGPLSKAKCSWFLGFSPPRVHTLEHNNCTVSERFSATDDLDQETFGKDKTFFWLSCELLLSGKHRTVRPFSNCPQVHLQNGQLRNTRYLAVPFPLQIQVASQILRDAQHINLSSTKRANIQNDIEQGRMCLP